MPRKPNDSSQTRSVLAVLAADATAWWYGLPLSRETGLSSGTLYPLLRRLADQGFLEAAWQPSDSPGRPPRHVYRLTASGRALARERASRGPTPMSRLAEQPS